MLTTIQRERPWQGHLVASSSRPQPNPESTSTRPSTISCEKSEDITARCRVTRPAAAVPRAPTDPLSPWIWTTASKKQDAVPSVCSCKWKRCMRTKSAHLGMKDDVIGRVYPPCPGLVNCMRYDVRMQYNLEACGRARGWNFDCIG